MPTPRILLVDGMDGTGKKTVTEKLIKRISSAERTVYFLDVPNYESVTGKLVKEYLTSGYQDVRERIVLSSFYSMDRNWMLREHFSQIFETPGVDYVIMNRWTLSNMVCNVTLMTQDAESDQKIRHKHSCEVNEGIIGGNLPRQGQLYQLTFPDKWLVDHKITTEIYEEYNGNFLSIAELFQLAKKLEEARCFNAYSVVNRAATMARALMIREHANFLYMLEVMPWWTSVNGREYLPFNHIDSVVLVTSPEVSRQNMMKRYKSESELDLNERNLQYQASIYESVEWMAAHHSIIYDPATSVLASPYGIIDALKTGDPACPYILSPHAFIPHVPIIASPTAFKYDLIHCDQIGEDGKWAMRSENDIYQEIWAHFGLDKEIGPA